MRIKNAEAVIAFRNYVAPIDDQYQVLVSKSF